MRIAKALISWLVVAVAAMVLSACGGGADPAATPASLDTKSTIQAAAGGADATGAAPAALTPISAAASSQERADLAAAKAIDGDASSRWSSGFSDAQWLSLDFGKAQSFDSLRIVWEAAHAKRYELQTSDDGSTWTTLRTVNDSVGGTETIGALAGQGRYLRLNGLQRSTPYGYSIFEIQAFGASGVVPPTPVPAPAQLAVVLQPIAATSSPVQNAGLAAANAIDGNLTTRWSSVADDAAWIQFDLGSVRAIGSVKLVWEAAYGRAFELQVSDDAQQWTALRKVAEGSGGTQEFLNLATRGRYVRVQGVKRATAFGYSLYEVEIKSQGSDNTLLNSAAASVPVPNAGAPAQALFLPQEPLETLQFSLADGTLITRFGNRAQGRHARERGEDWNEIGFGPNETVDPLTGAPLDKGPGAFLPFVPHYFQNRTWGLEIIDNSRVAGVTKPTLRFNVYNNSIEFKNDTITYFRGFDRPGVTGYGWNNGSSFATDPSRPFETDRCAPVPYPVGPQLGAPRCSTLVTEYPGHNALDAAGFPIPGQTVAARALVPGDWVEVAPSYFVDQAALDAKGDVGGKRYYSGEWLYVVGQGITPWYGVAPRLMGVPLPVDALSGGQGSVSYNYSDNGKHMFQQPMNHVGMQNMQRFVEGRRLIHTDFVSGQHTEPGNAPYLPAQGLSGTLFNQTHCVACHANNGRSPAASTPGQRLDNMTVKTAQLGSDGQAMPHARYGESIQMNARSGQDWGNGARLAGFEARSVTLADGTPVELRKPTLGFDGPVPTLNSLRSALPMIGVGLLEAVPEADILARVRNTPDADGVQGRANFAFDPENGTVRLGRFGWKAAKVSLRHQTAHALLNDMAVTSPLYPSPLCHANLNACKSAAPVKGVSEAELQAISRYLALLAVPAQRSLASGFPKGVSVLPEHQVDSTQVARGLAVFNAAKCSSCHVGEMKTGNEHPLAELRNQRIRPYSDLLLHDMGPGLADNYPEAQAAGHQWRTPPLWGLGYAPYVQGGAAKVGYLHDGRARTLTEAVMWHGGEAERSRQRFAALPTADRLALLAFLNSL
jgi:CxxC motif-containing protein (DUF1111 family)